MAAKFDGMERSEEWWVRRALGSVLASRPMFNDPVWRIVSGVEITALAEYGEGASELLAWHFAYLSPVVQSVVERERWGEGNAL